MTKPVELEIGDKVKIVRKITKIEDPSFKNSWADDMTDNIGKTGVVNRLNNYEGGYGVKIEGGGNYSYSRKSLRKVG